MDEASRESMLIALDEELLKGAVILSDWCTFIIQEADTAFINGANLASILTAVAGIETHLRAENLHLKHERLVTLIDNSGFDEDLKQELHALRRYRNRWVHIDEPWEEDSLLGSAENAQVELERMAIVAAKSLRRTIYQDQWT
jgi:hypothetical protein